MEDFKRVSRWLKIKYTSDGIPYFVLNNQRYYLSENPRSIRPFILRIGAFGMNNSEYPSYIHGYSSDYMLPLYIEISGDGEQVRCYERKETA